jgi:deoxyribonuclease-4
MPKVNEASFVTNRPKIGAHVSAAISLELAFDKAQQIGAECLQFFVSPPQQWAFTSHDNDEIERFKSKALETQIGPNFIHGTYLVNLGTEKPEHLRKSIDWLIYGMKMAEKLEIRGLIFHTGSHKGKGLDGSIEQIVGSIKEVLEKVPKVSEVPDVSKTKLSSPTPDTIGTYDTSGTSHPPYLILETSAGGGGSIGRNFSELGEILKLVQDDRVKVCIDTAHTFAAGYDWRSNIDEILNEFDREVGSGNLAAFHANDSKMDFESYKDRHANIGEGFMGQIAFAQLLNHPKLVDIPFLLEVPGFADEGPDAENIQIMKKLRN